MQDNEHQRYWLGMHLIPQFGNAKLAMLLARIPSVAELWQTSNDRLLSLDLPRQLLHQFIAGRRSIDLNRELDKVWQCGAHLVTIEDFAYPDLLREIADRPPVLYVRGILAEDDAKSIAVVGTRKPSKYGMDAARQLSQNLAQQDVAIVSGLAHGIDAAAHRGALQAGGRTIAVMATGIDSVYPSENHELAERHHGKRRPYHGDAHWHGAAWQEFSAAQSHHQRHVPRCLGCRGSGKEWCNEYSQPCD